MSQQGRALGAWIVRVLATFTGPLVGVVVDEVLVGLRPV